MGVLCFFPPFFSLPHPLPHSDGQRVELEIVQSVLGLTYHQGLIWFGMAFCPVLPILACITNAVDFYFFQALVSFVGLLGGQREGK